MDTTSTTAVQGSACSGSGQEGRVVYQVGRGETSLWVNSPDQPITAKIAKLGAGMQQPATAADATWLFRQGPSPNANYAPVEFFGNPPNDPNLAGIGSQFSEPSSGHRT
ncbi:hypothetical protein VFPPC_14340 [Pochonia chlamydosporia 170]|uniref:Uncharacterized protein n=1 Tax=Pochonia chlamydosporia 170 TaxID=1380566 RepID=A0A179FMM0_METCM|nr:hypothetical protein VFPPC_14340 [Pochonia chlamydosporia 170]OAQ66500.1 hypothetical protein VFPPC_14340 [Pochonia chlamydosporia 170]